MKNNDPDYTTITVIGVAVFLAYVYFLYADDLFGYLAAAGFFMVFVFEHLFNFISRTEGEMGKFKDSNLHRPIAFAVPGFIVFVTWLVNLAV